MNESCDILMVDDDTEDQMILQSFFGEAGLDGRVAYLDNGHKALKYLENIADDSKLPQLIVLDLNMPILNGSQTLMRLKATLRLRHIPVVIFSTSANETEKRKCMSIGAVDYLVKPLTMDECRAIIRKFSSFVEPRPDG